MKLLQELYTPEANVITEGTGADKKMFLEGVAIQMNIPNKNHRIYPKHHVQDEIQRYIKEVIEQNSGWSEGDHPNCFSGNTQALTESGWKYIKDVSIGELVYTYSIEKNEVIKSKVINVINQPYKGKMFSFINRGINTLVTPNHRFLIKKNKTKKISYKTAQEIYDNIYTGNLCGYSIIKSLGLGVKNTTQNFTIINEYGTLTFDKNIFAAFLGIYLSEGCVRYRKDRDVFDSITIFQNKGEKSKAIENILKPFYSQFGCSTSETDCYSGKKLVFNIYSRILATYLSQFGNCYDKYVDPDFLKIMDNSAAKDFLDAFILGDGRGILGAKCMVSDAFSVSEKLRDDLMHISLIAGIANSYTTEVCTKDYMFAGRIIKAENKKPLHFTKFLKTSGVYLDHRFMQIKEVDYDQNVYCLETETGNFYARENNFTFWTGNSPSINIDRVAGRYVSLKEDGNNYIGKMLITNTPMGNIVKGLIESGGRIGTSTRALGSVKKLSSGLNEVARDFKLITCGDVVLNPSAPDAYSHALMENIDWVYENGIWTESQAVEHKTRIIKASSKQLDEVKLSVWTEFLAEISA